MIALSGIAATLGLFIVYLLGSFMEWRNVALICLIVPIVTMIAVCFVSKYSFAYEFERIECMFHCYTDTRNTIVATVEKS